MTSNQYDKSYKYIEDSRFCFFEFFLIASRYEYEPTSVDNEYHTHQHEESVDIYDDLTHDTNRSRDVLVGNLTTSDIEDSSISTVG